MYHLLFLITSVLAKQLIFNTNMIYKDCSNANERENFYLNYIKYEINKDVLLLNIDGNVKQTITNGFLNVKIKFNRFTIYNKSLDLCQTISKYEKCPISIGHKHFNESINVHKILKGKYIIDIKSENLLCLNIIFEYN